MNIVIPTDKVIVFIQNIYAQINDTLNTQNSLQYFILLFGTYKTYREIAEAKEEYNITQ